VAIGKKKPDTMGDEDTLFHGEPLFIVSASNAEDVAFPFLTKRITGNFLGDFLGVEDTAALTSGIMNL